METAQISSIVATVITAILTYLNWRTTNNKTQAESGKIKAEGEVTLGDGWVKLTNELQEQLGEQHAQILKLIHESETWKIERKTMMTQLEESHREIGELREVLDVVRGRVTELERINKDLTSENARLRMCKGKL